MAKKSKLLLALDAHKGRDYQAEKRKAQVKAAEKRKRQKLAKQDDDDDDEDVELINGDADKENIGSFAKDDFADFDGHESTVKEVKSILKTTNATDPAEAEVAEDDDEDEDEEDEEEDEEDVPLSDLDASDREDTIPYQRLTINNGPALTASRDRIALIPKSKAKKTPFHHHNSLISTLPPSSSTIPDPNDDLTRESEFYKIARTATIHARTLLRDESIPFTRPSDFFAEMVKTDEHMGRIKQKMHDEAASKKGREEARRLREAKKFGKQVQVAKEQERQKEKRDTLERIKELKRSTSLVSVCVVCVRDANVW
jgi:rRNA-processing protein EBP2